MADATGLPLPEPRPGVVFALVLQPPARACQPLPGALRVSAISGELLRNIQIVDSYGDHRVIEVQNDSIYRAAGSLHGCALFCGTEPWGEY